MSQVQAKQSKAVAPKPKTALPVAANLARRDGWRWT